MNSPYADAFGLEAQAKKAEQMKQEAAARATEKVATFNPIRKHGNIIGYRIYINEIYTWMVKAVKERAEWGRRSVIVAYKRNADNKMALTPYRVETGIKVLPHADIPAIPQDLLKNLVNEIMDKVGVTNSLQGHRANRRTGNLMGLGALQAHDRASFLVHEQGMTPTQRRSYLQAERSGSPESEQGPKWISPSNFVRNQSLALAGKSAFPPLHLTQFQPALTSNWLP